MKVPVCTKLPSPVFEKFEQHRRGHGNIPQGKAVEQLVERGLEVATPTPGGSTSAKGRVVSGYFSHDLWDRVEAFRKASGSPVWAEIIRRLIVSGLDNPPPPPSPLAIESQQP